MITLQRNVYDSYLESNNMLSINKKEIFKFLPITACLSKVNS